MKHSFIYPVSIALLLAVSPSHGEQWERQLEAAEMNQNMSASAAGMHEKWSVVQEHRREQLERGGYQNSAIDIENLPPTAAGPRDDSGMKKDWAEVEANRRRQLERGMY